MISPFLSLRNELLTLLGLLFKTACQCLNQWGLQIKSNLLEILFRLPDKNISKFYFSTLTITLCGDPPSVLMALCKKMCGLSVFFRFKCNCQLSPSTNKMFVGKQYTQEIAAINKTQTTKQELQLKKSEF